MMPQLPPPMPPSGIVLAGQSVIPQELRNPIKSSLSRFCETTVRPQVDTDKITWTARVRRNFLYYRGLQYLSYVPGGQSGIPDFQPVTGRKDLQLQNINENSTLFDYVLNVFQGDVDTFIAVVGSRSPNVQAQARDLCDVNQVRLKLKADRVSAYLDSSWNVPALHMELVRGLALYGTMFSHVRYSVNARKWGTSNFQQYRIDQVPMGQAYYQCYNCGTETPADQANSLQAQYMTSLPGQVPCSKCGIPLGPSELVQPDMIPSLVPSEVIQFANGACEIDLLHPGHVTGPVHLPNEKMMPWFLKETEQDKGALIAAYPELRDKAYTEEYRVDADAAAAAGRWTRDLLSSPSGYLVPKSRGRWLHSLLWLLPSTYEYLPNDRSGNVRDWLYNTYRDGIRVTMVNGEVLLGQGQPGVPGYIPPRLINEALPSVITSCKPKPSEMIYADPYFECMIQATDCINDSVSMVIEQAERSNPFVIADPEVFDPNMIRNTSGIPGEFKFAKAGSVQRLENAFFRVPAAEINGNLITFIDKYIAWCREITGITPAVFGGDGGGGDKTARQYEIMRNQAMMKLNVPWANTREFWAQTKENGIYQIAKYSGGKLYSSNRQMVEMVEIDGVWELARGGWYMQCEESMPQSIGQRRDFFMNTLTMPPEAQETFGVKEPDNIIKLQEAIGEVDWKTPGYDMVIRIHSIISQLIAAQPIPGQPGPPDPADPMQMPGPPGPPQPSIPFDQTLLDPVMAQKVVQGWMLSDKGQDVELTNSPGFDNVRAYLQQVHQAMPPPPPEQPKVSITIDFSNLIPDAQQSIFQQLGISVNVPPGAPLALPKPAKAEMGGPGAPPSPPHPPHPGHSPLPSSQAGPSESGPLGAPPPGMAPPSDLGAAPPMSDLAAPPPGGMAGAPPNAILNAIGVQ